MRPLGPRQKAFGQLTETGHGFPAWFLRRTDYRGRCPVGAGCAS